MDARIARGTPMEDAWNETSIELVAAAEAHTRAFVVDTYDRVMTKLFKTVSKDLGTVLSQLLHLYGVYVALKSVGDLFRVHTCLFSKLLNCTNSF